MPRAWLRISWPARMRRPALLSPLRFSTTTILVKTGLRVKRR